MALYTLYDLYGAELTLATAGLVVLLLLWVAALQWRLARLRRADPAPQAEPLQEASGTMLWQRRTLAEHTERLAAVETTVTNHVARVGMVRFNAFQDSGGDQSFAVAWLDSQANGIVISSLHSRAGTRLYAKPVERGGSPYTLTEEEKAAIQAAGGG